MSQEKFRNIGLIARTESEQTLYSVRQLIHFLHGRDCTVILDRAIAGSLPESGLQAAKASQMGDACDLVIVVGGDGTMLRGKSRRSRSQRGRAPLQRCVHTHGDQIALVLNSRWR